MTLPISVAEKRFRFMEATFKKNRSHIGVLLRSQNLALDDHLTLNTEALRRIVEEIAALEKSLALNGRTGGDMGAKMMWAVIHPITRHCPIEVPATVTHADRVRGYVNAAFAVLMALAYLRIRVPENSPFAANLITFVESGGVAQRTFPNLMVLRFFLDAYRKNCVITGSRRVKMGRWQTAAVC